MLIRIGFFVLFCFWGLLMIGIALALCPFVVAARLANWLEKRNLPDHIKCQLEE